MDTLHSALRESSDHRDDVEAAQADGTTRLRPLARTRPVVATPAGAGWYHEAAIVAAGRDAIEARCNPYHG